MNKYLKNGQKNPLRAFSVRLPEDMIETLDAIAGANRRNRNAQIAYMLEAYMDLVASKSVKGDAG